MDAPLPIGYGQTISAPHMVAMMAEALELEVDHKLLEVGSGSGYHAAVLAEIVAPRDAEKKGHVYTVEIIPELFAFARTNLESTGYGNRVTVIPGDGSVGYPEHAPYDRILVTAAAPKIIKALVEELEVGGILVTPVGGAYFYQELMKVKKESEDRVFTWSLCGVAFVPLRGKDGWEA
ncbi:MAG: protein-L-isoaspartate O-methyltransferase [Candidatus Bathyarchaeota archaeon]